MAERCVMVGAGGISNAWFPPLKAEGVDLVAVVDLRVQNAEAQLAKYELTAEVSDDLTATLAKHRPDFVLDLTVPEAHCEVTCAALAAGCPVIGEKPMAGSLAEARRMVQAAEQAGQLYMVSQSRRWNALHDSVRRTVAAGELGPVTTVNCDFYLGAHFGGFRDAMPSPLILDMAIHHFDLARFMTGLDAEAVYALEYNPQGSWYAGDVAATCVFELTGGVVFTYRGSWCAEGCHTSWNGNWRIVGEQGTLLYEQDQPPRGQVVDGDEGFNRPLRDLSMVASPRQQSGMHGSLCELLAYLRGGPTPQTECHDNFRSLAMVQAAIESSRQRQRVAVEQL